ncbi:MAG: sigma-70 family RNA polymerase sigma factor [Gaiellaceae bacterium]
MRAYTEYMGRRSDDTTLIRLIRRGDREAMARLCETYWPVAWKSAYAVLFDRTLSDDATQEAMLRVLRALDTFDETRPLAPWIRRIALNQALDQLRRDRRLVPVPEPPEDPIRHAWSDDASELHIGIAEAVAALVQEKRVVTVLHYWLDYSLQEIADVLGLPIGTVMSRISRARTELRDSMKEDENAA